MATDDLSFLDQTTHHNVKPGKSKSGTTFSLKKPGKKVVQKPDEGNIFDDVKPKVHLDHGKTPSPENPVPLGCVLEGLAQMLSGLTDLEEIPALCEAEHMGDLVRGTSRAYIWIAKAKRLRAAYSVTEAGDLAIRVEPEPKFGSHLAPADVYHLKAVGFKINPKMNYASIHFSGLGTNVSLHRRTIGSVLFACGEWTSVHWESIPGH